MMYPKFKEVLNKIFDVCTIVLATITTIISLITVFLMIGDTDFIEIRIDYIFISVFLVAMTLLAFMLALKTIKSRSQPRKKIFVSFAIKDDFAFKLVKRLHQNLYVTILTVGDILVSDNIEEKLKELINDAEIFIAVFTQESIKSVWCMNEYQFAIEAGKDIFPIVAGDVDTDKLPFDYKAIASVAFKDEKDIDKVVYEIIRAIKNKEQHSKK